MPDLKGTSPALTIYLPSAQNTRDETTCWFCSPQWEYPQEDCQEKGSAIADHGPGPV